MAWPAVNPETLVFALLSDAGALAGAAEGILTPAEQALLTWAKPARSAKVAKWSPADLFLVDEASGLIERPTGYGHVVLDEAQDLSPMQCRAVARRSEHSSITLLGDLAQGTAPWAARHWRDTLAHLGKPDAEVVALTTGFRVPAAVLALANRLLPALDVDVPAAHSLRRDGDLSIHLVNRPFEAAVEQVRAALHHEGSIGVIAADSAVGDLIASLEAAGIAAGDAESDGRVSVLPATIAKGLEYDHVIVVEPADIVAAEPRGLNRLYVVLTRAVSRLTIVHAKPLPDVLTARC